MHYFDEEELDRFYFSIICDRSFERVILWQGFSGWSTKYHF